MSVERLAEMMTGAIAAVICEDFDFFCGHLKCVVPAFQTSSMSQTTLLLNLKFFNTSTSPRKTSSLRSLTIHTSFEWQITMTS